MPPGGPDTPRGLQGAIWDACRLHFGSIWQLFSLRVQVKKNITESLTRGRRQKGVSPLDPATELTVTDPEVLSHLSSAGVTVEAVASSIRDLHDASILDVRVSQTVEVDFASTVGASWDSQFDNVTELVVC